VGAVVGHQDAQGAPLERLFGGHCPPGVRDGAGLVPWCAGGRAAVPGHQALLERRGALPVGRRCRSEGAIVRRLPRVDYPAVTTSRTTGSRRGLVRTAAELD